ncbi:uncharacterized protein COLE_07016 [Cutaneotrichosporon oleaginosum]|uniref:uncharacterized protein n=1 Tax=Cutaneotrichosporon oleaginosum TaxID=879819 RepID=UPI0013260C35|nr:hypothetical protein COLE_07016 [Cutaneotrichosporon oleaginosum]
MADDVGTLIREVLPPVPDALRTKYAPLFTTDDVGPLDAVLEKEYPEATRRRRALPATLAAFSDLSDQAAIDAWLTQYAAGVKAIHNPDTKYDTYLPSCFYAWLAREGDHDLSHNWSEALAVAGQRDVSYTDSQFFFPVALDDRWALVHISYVEDRVTLFDPAGLTQVLDVVQAHIAAADKAHYGKTHRLGAHVLSCGRVSKANSALVVCAALEVFPSRHYRDERSAAFDRLAEAIEADTPLAELVGAQVDVGGQRASVRGGIRAALLDRAKFTWATGVPVNAEGIAVLAKA